MSACAMLSYNNVTPTAWQCMIGAAAQYGVTITGPQGNATASGFSVAWNYDQDTQNLHVQCTDSPFWAPCATINSKLAAAVEGCLTNENIDQSPMVPA